MKIYLSGPMSGCPQFNIPAFRDAAMVLRSQGYKVVSPHELDEASGLDLQTLLGSHDGKANIGATWGELIARDVKVIADGGICGIVVLPGWHKSKGAKLEVFLGILLQIPLFKYAGFQPPEPLGWADAQILMGVN